MASSTLRYARFGSIATATRSSVSFPFPSVTADRSEGLSRVANDLKKYGLRYDDLLDPSGNMDVAAAMSRLPQEVLDARNQRLKRALDISLKHTYLPKDLQAKQTPLEPYLRPMLRQVQAEMKERKMLGTKKPYDRQLP